VGVRLRGRLVAHLVGGAGEALGAKPHPAAVGVGGCVAGFARTIGRACVALTAGRRQAMPRGRALEIRVAGHSRAFRHAARPVRGARAGAHARVGLDVRLADHRSTSGTIAVGRARVRRWKAGSAPAGGLRCAECAAGAVGVGPANGVPRGRAARARACGEAPTGSAVSRTRRGWTRPCDAESAAVAVGARRRGARRACTGSGVGRPRVAGRPAVAPGALDRRAGRTAEAAPATRRAVGRPRSAPPVHGGRVGGRRLPARTGATRRPQGHAEHRRKNTGPETSWLAHLHRSGPSCWSEAFDGPRDYLSVLPICIPAAKYVPVSESGRMS
jgi:hypothetical protein